MMDSHLTRCYQGLIDSTRREHATSIVTAVCKILIVAKNSNKCGQGQMEAVQPVNATLVLVHVGVLGECF